jgi:hypothetical protein
MSVKFPLTLEAAQDLERLEGRGQWKIGDALLKECGPPGESSKTDGSRAKLDAVVQELFEHGLEYDIRYIASLREVAFNFPKASRDPTVSWSVHRHAQTPEILQAIVQGAGKKRITNAYVTDVRDRWTERERAQQERDRKAALEKARRDAEAAEKAEAEARKRAREAEDEAERARLKKEADEARKRKNLAKDTIRENRNAPKKSNKKTTTAPPVGEVGGMAIEAKVIAQALNALAMAKETKKLIGPHAKNLPDDAVAALAETALKAANAWTDVANVVRSHSGNKRGHLSVVA